MNRVSIFDWGRLDFCQLHCSIAHGKGVIVVLNIALRIACGHS